ncbi:inhibitor of apoptosis 3 [Choristoneura fumiferana multiple nucleopolyhedrovirus]|uniref:IAP protein n=1 Tax=Choristoneura fumiferana nuclear polyhedrosis virus TaxID=208973 RepID=Q9YNL8_NPVCF|nr:inhibitor of apoptosis 3 [Choristoneura fumiferana multiple nucleopolyhedrovirus]AAD00537.1 IAP [Choristoneura fumiferana multiple nucleopolyhedrovirus]AAP29821.1 inhibitor of apoptosis 3 [Choristoneura fumiferana multiple nucleopolyhedrovirus]
MNEQTVVVADKANMEDENARLATYTNWTVEFMSPRQMAANGFYYLGRGDEVRCAFCKVEIMRWEAGDDPARDHQKWAPQCPFLRRSGATLSAPQERAGLHAPQEREATNQLPSPPPAHPKYAIEAARLRTFTEWPRGLKQRPEKLAEAGFFYTGRSDKVKCFYCDGGLDNWEQDDEPWQQHALWFGRCAYVLLVKGRDYVQKVVTESCAIRDTTKKQVVKHTVYEPNLPDEKLCKICYYDEKIVCFVPCGHVVACGKCASSLTNCPICRVTVETAVRMYQI